MQPIITAKLLPSPKLKLGVQEQNLAKFENKLHFPNPHMFYTSSDRSTMINITVHTESTKSSSTEWRCTIPSETRIVELHINAQEELTKRHMTGSVD